MRHHAVRGILVWLPATMLVPPDMVHMAGNMQGVRAFVLLNNSDLVSTLSADSNAKQHKEVYQFWKDDSRADGTWRGAGQGEPPVVVVRGADLADLAEHHLPKLLSTR